MVQITLERRGRANAVGLSMVTKEESEIEESAITS